MESSEPRRGNVLTALRLDSIRNRILILALLATLIPAASTVVLSYVQNRRALTETLEGELRGIASQSARELDLWIKERFYDLRVFVGSFEVSENLDRIPRGGLTANDALDRLTDYLVGVQSRFGDYAELLVLDASARPVATSGGTLGASDIPAEWLPALERRETRLGEPYWDEALGAVVATMAVPIESADGRFLGVLQAKLRFDAVRAVLTESRLGERGRIDLLTSDGRVIVASSPTEGFESTVTDETLARLSAASGVGTMEYVDNSGISMVGTLTAVERWNWFVLTHRPTSEAYAQVTELRTQAFVLVSLLLMAVGAIAYFIGLFIVRPLATLTGGARAVAAGDLSVDLPVTGRDEVGYLTEVFNGMVAQLRANRDQLDEANSILREQNSELERISMTDALTSLFNRRYVMQEFDKEIHRASRHERKFAVLMMDVDRFKQYNDSFGHPAGDQVLMGMGRVVREATREPDIPARYGGEEFIVLLPDCDLQGAVDAAERIRTRLAKEVFDGRQVTVSIGAAEYPTHGDSAKELIGAADVALYEAKAGGRDRVMAAGQTAPKTDAPEDEARKESPAAKSKTAPKKKKAGPKKK